MSILGDVLNNIESQLDELSGTKLYERFICMAVHVSYGKKKIDAYINTKLLKRTCEPLYKQIHTPRRYAINFDDVICWYIGNLLINMNCLDCINSFKKTMQELLLDDCSINIISVDHRVGIARNGVDQIKIRFSLEKDEFHRTSVNVYLVKKLKL